MGKMRHEREDDLIVSSSRSLSLRVIVTFGGNMFKYVAKTLYLRYDKCNQMVREGQKCLLIPKLKKSDCHVF